MTYRTEFPDFPQGDIPATFLKAPWIDESWHNDACPSFSRPLGDGREAHVYVDWLKVADREDSAWPRFTVRFTDDNSLDFSTDSLPSLLDRIGFIAGAMTHNDLTREYEDWLAANPNVPPISADEAAMELCEAPPADRSPSLQAQIDWLMDFISRWEKASD